MNRISLLHREMSELNAWLNAFETPHAPRAQLLPSGETLRITNFPLPEGFSPDRVHMALIVRDFPSDPPKGLYLYRKPGAERVIAQLAHHFNVFAGRGFHGAPSIPDFEWLCVGYLNGWRYDLKAPHRGDNITKMLGEFYRLAEEALHA